jgi:hypothetical protein
MPAHLRPLPKCDACGATATTVLMNTWNAECGRYCNRHAAGALKDFRRRYEQEA